MYIEKLRSLMEKAPGEAADIAEYAQMLTKYVNTVADQVLATERNRAFLISERIDQTEYIARIERANDERNKAHDKACAACKNINDIAARNGKQKIFDFEPQIETINGRMVSHRIIIIMWQNFARILQMNYSNRALYKNPSI